MMNTWWRGGKAAQKGSSYSGELDPLLPLRGNSQRVEGIRVRYNIFFLQYYATKKNCSIVCRSYTAIKVWFANKTELEQSRNGNYRRLHGRHNKLTWKGNWCPEKWKLFTLLSQWVGERELEVSRVWVYQYMSQHEHENNFLQHKHYEILSIWHDSGSRKQKTSRKGWKNSAYTQSCFQLTSPCWKFELFQIISY